MGQAEYWPWKTHEEAIAYQLKPLGISYEQFIKDGGGLRSDAREFKWYERTGFPTATGKVELYSTVLEKLGYDPLPYYEEPPESPVNTPELAKQYPWDVQGDVGSKTLCDNPNPRHPGDLAVTFLHS